MQTGVAALIAFAFVFLFAWLNHNVVRVEALSAVRIALTVSGLGWLGFLAFASPQTRRYCAFWTGDSSALMTFAICAIPVIILLVWVWKERVDA
jgi:ABC-type uncharacterized transport system permease subunit